MDACQRRAICLIGVVLVGFVLAGCEEPLRAPARPGKTGAALELGATIGSLVEFISIESIPVEGYGLVGGLQETGSSECPPEIRKYLTQYILKQVREPTTISIEKFINSHATAVVRVEGMMPAAVTKGERFDVRIEALSGTQTTSLAGGWLYGTELHRKGGFGLTKVLAAAEGPIFIDTIENVKASKREGYVLNGGKVRDEYRVGLALLKPDYAAASLIRDRINERFGPGTAKAISSGRIELKVPAKYAEQKQKFISLVGMMYLAETPEATKERVSTFVKKLVASEDKEASEIALEAIGNKSLGKLHILLNLSNEEVLLRAARCILNLGSDGGLETLRDITLDKNSTYRVKALEAITRAATRNDATAISRRLLSDEDFNIRLAAYEQLRKLDDITVTRDSIGRKFYLDQIAQTAPEAIYATRSGEPRIVLFGAPISCQGDIFVQSADGNITINAPAGQKYVSIIRKHPNPEKPNVVVQLKSFFELGDIIRTLCEEPAGIGEEGKSGLGVSYADMIMLLKQMCEKGAVKAEFRMGPGPAKK
jgi:flagellar basal body P-ring protein FlgI